MGASPETWTGWQTPCPANGDALKLVLADVNLSGPLWHTHISDDEATWLGPIAAGPQCGRAAGLLPWRQEKPDRDLTVVSMLHLADGIQYRLVGPTANGYPSARETGPGLGDGKVWLMKNSGYAVEAL